MLSNMIISDRNMKQRVYKRAHKFSPNRPDDKNAHKLRLSETQRAQHVNAGELIVAHSC